MSDDALIQKQCTKCDELKPLDAFPMNNGGRHPQCKQCRYLRYNTMSKSTEFKAKKNASWREWYFEKGGKEITRERHNQWRRTTKYKSYSDPEAYRAKEIVATAVRRGLLTKTSCEKCGSDNRVEGHHDDYNLPLAVRWLCNPCHREWHRHNEPIRKRTDDASAA